MIHTTNPYNCRVDFKKGDIVIYPQHGACKVKGFKKIAFPGGEGKKEEYIILETVINPMTLSVPTSKLDQVGVRPPVNSDELDDLVAVLSKSDPRVPSNWSRRFKNHQEKMKSGDIYECAEVVRNLALRDRQSSLSSAEKAMQIRARRILVSELAVSWNTTMEDAGERVDAVLAKD